MSIMTAEVLEKALSRSRLSPQDGLALLSGQDILSLGQAAHAVRLKKTDPSVATYIVDHNINYTNVCALACDFCAFSRRAEDTDSYVLTREELDEKIAMTKALGGTQILLQGGLHPGLSLSWHVDMIRHIKEAHGIHIHAFSPPEIKHFAQSSGKSFRQVLETLRSAGLDSLPGGGAEILSDRVRSLLSPGKCTSGEWLQIMEEAHAIGMRTTATMMFGHVETREERIAHWIRLRDLQDRTGGFTAFIAWTYRRGPLSHALPTAQTAAPAAGRPGEKTRRPAYLAGISGTSAWEYLRMVAVSRLMLDNFTNIQASWLTEGKKTGQLALRFGANDMGSIMMEENVVRAAGVRHCISVEEIRRLIADAGFTPRQRNVYYELI